MLFDFANVLVFLGLAIVFVAMTLLLGRIIRPRIPELNKDDAYFKDPGWMALNAPGARYGTGGAAARTSDMFAFTHPATGFVNRYSQSGVEEDMAEVFAVLSMSDELKEVEHLAERDHVLRSKLDYMRSLIERYAKD